MSRTPSPFKFSVPSSLAIWGVLDPGTNSAKPSLNAPPPQLIPAGSSRPYLPVFFFISLARSSKSFQLVG